jgi:two-component system alkaline phosphatase synthesis response regulator PhoP
MDQKIIWVLDDDEDIVDALSSLLEIEGFAVKGFSQPKELFNWLDVLSSGHPDLILIDVLLSGDDGRSVAQKLRQDNKIGHAKIVLMSAHPTILNNLNSDIAEAVISKPFDIPKLLDLVRSLTV